MIDALPASLRPAVSVHTGIVRTLEECLPGTADPPHFQAACTIAGGNGILGASLGHAAGIGGAGLRRSDAAAASVGEALERYSASFAPIEALVTASAHELGDEAVIPERFALFSERQHAQPGFPFRPFTSETRVRWVRGWSVGDGRPAWLPAELVFLDGAGLPDERPIGYATSSGFACASAPHEALERGICELLERDAFMLVWANRLMLPRIDWSRDERLRELDERLFAVTGLAYAVVDLSPVHRLPSFLGVVRAPRGHPGALGVGAGTAAGVERAWWKALAEAFASRSASAKLELVGPPREYGPGGEDVLTFDDPIRFYADHDRAQPAGFLAASSRTTPAGAVPALGGPDVLAELLRRVEVAGSSLYAVDATSPDVRELGVVVIKAVAPELCALDVPHVARFLGGRRLYEAPVRLGLREQPLSEDSVNPAPHPFP
jgi:ribosomal protein S12 methylthiotransferase accessory factor